MKFLLLILTSWLICNAGVMSSGLAKTDSNDNPLVLMSTELGDIEIEIFIDKAPVSSGNFLEYIKKNMFGDACFYRVVTLDNQPYKKIKIINP